MPIHASAAFLLLAIPAALTGAQTVPPFAQQAPLISTRSTSGKTIPTSSSLQEAA